jgi:hypothetical protein
MNSGYLHFPEFDPVIFSIGPVSPLVRVDVPGGLCFCHVARHPSRQPSGQRLDEK